LSFEFDYRALSGKLRLKMMCGRESLIDQERYLTLEMPTSEIAHIEREREKTPAKQHQDKA
jgi:hypothetical protein